MKRLNAINLQLFESQKLMINSTLRKSISLTLLIMLSFITELSATSYTSSGNWTCPSGVTTVTVECIGAGGGGAGGTDWNKAGGGGGGGAYTKATSVSVTPGTTYTVTVGVGGNGGSTGANGSDGTSSSFNGISANPGKGGKANSNGAGGGAGGTGGTYSGGNGGTGNAGWIFIFFVYYNGLGGGAANSSSNGTNAGTGSANLSVINGSNGTIYGTGGDGGTKTGTGGRGADGQVIITYINKPSVDPISLASTYCAGDILNLNNPTVTNTGSPITTEGWEIENTVGGGTFTSLVMPHTLASADNNKNIRYRATNADGDSYSNEVAINIAQDSTHWNGSFDSDWTNSNNWTNGVPNACTDVTIDNSGVMPNINSGGKVSCKNIKFEAGTSIYGLQNLVYEKAFVKLELTRDKWYILTSPLKEMYSSDYYFTGAPVSQIKLFGTTNASAATFGSSYVVSGDWTNSFASLAEALTPGEGFAYLLSSDEFDYPNGINTNAAPKTITFPRTEADESLSTLVVPYSAISGKPFATVAKSISKDSYKAYRFAMEDDGDTLNTISIHLEPGYNLIGNPLMSNLDLESTIKANFPLIDMKAYFWNGSGYESIILNSDNTITCSTTSLSAADLIIPPMQSFVIFANQAGDFFININDFTPNAASALRSSRIKANQLFIETDNGKAKSSSAIVLNDESSNSFDETDVCKLCSRLADGPEIYTIASNKSLDINQINKCPSVIPIGIKSEVNEAVNISFKGVESFDNVEVRLINTASGESINLKENNNYSFDFDGTNGEGNLFLEFRSTNINTDDELANSEAGINIFGGLENNIHVLTSAGNKQLEIFVYDTLGKLVAHKKSVSNTSETINIPQGGNVFIVKVISDKGVETKKIIL